MNTITEDKLRDFTSLNDSPLWSTSYTILYCINRRLDFRRWRSTKTKPKRGRHWWRLYWRANFRLFYIFLMRDSLNNNINSVLVSMPPEYSRFHSEELLSMCNLNWLLHRRSHSAIIFVSTYWTTTTTAVLLIRTIWNDSGDKLTLLICLWIARWENIV